MKSAAKLLAGLALIAALAWAGTYLYWHIKLVGAVQTLQSQAAPLINDKSVDPLKGEAFETLAAGGCRSLSYLVGALNAANNAEVMWEAFHRIFSASVPPPSADPETKAALEFLEDNRLHVGETAQKRHEKIERLRAWWADNGEKYHQSWRVWSSKCCNR